MLVQITFSSDKLCSFDYSLLFISPQKPSLRLKERTNYGLYAKTDYETRLTAISLLPNGRGSGQRTQKRPIFRPCILAELVKMPCIFDFFPKKILLSVEDDKVTGKQTMTLWRRIFKVGRI